MKYNPNMLALALTSAAAATAAITASYQSIAHTIAQ